MESAGGQPSGSSAGAGSMALYQTRGSSNRHSVVMGQCQEAGVGCRDMGVQSHASHNESQMLAARGEPDGQRVAKIAKGTKYKESKRASVLPYVHRLSNRMFRVDTRQSREPPECGTLQRQMQLHRFASFSGLLCKVRKRDVARMEGECWGLPVGTALA